MTSTLFIHNSREEWSPKSGAFPMLVRRFSSNSLSPMRSATAVGVARSFREGYKNKPDCGSVKLKSANFYTKMGVREASKGEQRFDVIESSLYSTKNSCHPAEKNNIGNLPFYCDTSVNWSEDCLTHVRVGRCSPLHLRNRCLFCPLKSFWRIRGEILRFHNHDNFSHLFDFSWQRLFPLESASLSLSGFCEVMKTVLNMALDFSDIFLLFSFICGERSEVTTIFFSEEVKKLFFPSKILSTYVCVHISKKATWPSYFFVTRDQVQNLLSDVEEVKKCSFPSISDAVRDIFFSLRHFGLRSDRLSITTLHDIFCADKVFLECLRAPVDFPSINM